MADILTKAKVGAKVEFKADEDRLEGYAGAWFEGVLEEDFNSNKSKLRVTHTRFKLPDGQKHTEVIRPQFFRPCPPPAFTKVCELQIGASVNALQRHCWWNGVVVKRMDAGKYMVFFSKPVPDICIIPIDELKLNLSWKDGKWREKPKKEIVSPTGEDVTAKLIYQRRWRGAVGVCFEELNHVRVKFHDDLEKIEATHVLPRSNVRIPEKVTDDVEPKEEEKGPEGEEEDPDWDDPDWEDSDEEEPEEENQNNEDRKTREQVHIKQHEHLKSSTDDSLDLIPKPTHVGIPNKADNDKVCSDIASLKAEKLPRALKKSDETVIDVDELEPLSSTVVDESLPDIYYPSRDDANSVCLNWNDTRCLQPGGKITSQVLNYYIRFLQEEAFSSNGKKSADHHFFSTYFFRKLTDLCNKEVRTLQDHEILRRWWKDIHLFDKAYAFIPIHKDLHWSLVIVCFPYNESDPEAIIFHLDSLGFHDSQQIFTYVQWFLRNEYMKLHSEQARPLKFECLQAEVPKQENTFDCGMFVMLFMKLFIAKSPSRMEINKLEIVNLSMFNKDWFSINEVNDLRSEICKAVAHLFVVNDSRDQNPSSHGVGMKDKEVDNQHEELNHVRVKFHDDLKKIGATHVLPRSNVRIPEKATDDVEPKEEEKGPEGEEQDHTAEDFDLASLPEFKGKQLPHFKGLVNELPCVQKYLEEVLVKSYMVTRGTLGNLGKDVSGSTLVGYKNLYKKLVKNGFGLDEQLQWISELIDIKDVVKSHLEEQKEIEKSRVEKNSKIEEAKTLYGKLQKDKAFVQKEMETLSTKLETLNTKMESLNTKIETLNKDMELELEPKRVENAKDLRTMMLKFENMVNKPPSF